MKVKELIEKLKQYPKNATVFMASQESSENDRDILRAEYDDFGSGYKEVGLIVESKKNCFKQTLKTYCNIFPEDRLQELELHAFSLMSGEDVETTLEATNEELSEEYHKLCNEE